MSLNNVWENWRNGIDGLKNLFKALINIIKNTWFRSNSVAEYQWINLYGGRVTKYKCPVCGDVLLLNRKEDGVVYYNCNNCYKELKCGRHMGFIGVLDK